MDIHGTFSSMIGSYVVVAHMGGLHTAGIDR
jgi:hypothetical protein